jgi:hypothetical protein
VEVETITGAFQATDGMVNRIGRREAMLIHFVRPCRAQYIRRLWQGWQHARLAKLHHDEGIVQRRYGGAGLCILHVFDEEIALEGLRYCQGREAQPRNSGELVG